MKPLRLCALIALLVTPVEAQEPVDTGMMAKIRSEGYDVRTHHTNADFVERIEPDALKQASVAIASVLYQAAMRDAKMPR